MDADRYLARIGIDPDSVSAPDHETLARLQAAHLRTVPFETLAITGDPFDDRAGDGVSLAATDLFEKIVDRERGGFCFELNGLFAWLLDEIGFETARIAGRMLGDDSVTLPANHLIPTVTLDRTYVVDAGMGTPKIRRPVPLNGTTVSDELGAEWRVVESDRPDTDFRTQYRQAREDDWTDRYVFTTEPRDLSYFHATCDYLASAPESGFTGSPVLVIGTDYGYVKLTGQQLTRVANGDETESTLSESEWHETVADTFGIDWAEARA